MGLVAGSEIKATFSGDKSLNKRPMKRILKPLELSGCEILSNEDKLPVSIRGSRIPMPIKYESPISSAQIKSCVLLNGLTSIGNTIFTEPIKSRDHTELMLNFMGAKITSQTLKNGSHNVKLIGLPNLKGKNYV